ncbi:MAG: hypothetical protein AVDCRST_MAG01-01-2922, partial [uncultured Rubrobacteraceae bacterium]
AFGGGERGRGQKGLRRPQPARALGRDVDGGPRRFERDAGVSEERERVPRRVYGNQRHDSPHRPDGRPAPDGLPRRRPRGRQHSPRRLLARPRTCSPAQRRYHAPRRGRAALQVTARYLPNEGLNQSAKSV